jgi:protein-tyrosine phosphatase
MAGPLRSTGQLSPWVTVTQCAGEPLGNGALHAAGLSSYPGLGEHDVLMDTRERLLPLVGASNFRDLGGYPTTDGGLTRWGELFRSDTLHELTEADLEVLRGVGLATVIDLRTATERDRSGRGLLGQEDVAYLHVSVLQEEGGESVAVPAPSDDDPAERYMWYLEVGHGALTEALVRVADPKNRPLVFHCAAGKDRTGVLAALILDILGVEHSVIVDDYAITATRMELILERLRRDPVWGSSVAEIPPGRVLAEAATMERFLELLHVRHGGARQWALAAGVPEESLDHMAAQLVDRGTSPV